MVLPLHLSVNADSFLTLRHQPPPHLARLHQTKELERRWEDGVGPQKTPPPESDTPALYLQGCPKQRGLGHEV